MDSSNAAPLALVTGSCGLIGSEVSVFFHKAGFRIAGIDSNARAEFFGPEGDTSWVLGRLTPISRQNQLLADNYKSRYKGVG